MDFIDKTSDVEGQYVANVFFGTLENDQVCYTGNIFLLNSEALEKSNLIKLLQNSLTKLCLLFSLKV